MYVSIVSIFLYFYCNEVSSMKESHDWEHGGGCGCQWCEDIEKETVLADCFWAKDVRRG